MPQLKEAIKERMDVGNPFPILREATRRNYAKGFYRGQKSTFKGLGLPAPTWKKVRAWMKMRFRSRLQEKKQSRKKNSSRTRAKENSQRELMLEISRWTSSPTGRSPKSVDSDPDDEDQWGQPGSYPVC